MSKRLRLDAELVRRNLARSRQHAAELISAGRVSVDGQAAAKPATQILTSQAILLAHDSEDPEYASRGGFKLAGALAALGAQAPPLQDRWALDAGASTGGFTDVLLREGVQHVYAVDVGYGQLLWRLQDDPRVTVMDRTNVRHLAPEDFPTAPDVVVSDLSFISLTLVIPALANVAAPGADFLLMVKPQFEVGKERLGSGGVVRDPELHASAVRHVLDCALGQGLGVQAVVASPLPGPAGNVEYFVHLNSAGRHDGLEQMIETAIANGPARKDA